MTHRRTLIRSAATLALATLLSSCAAPPAPAERPRLVVLLVVDGLPMRQVTDYRAQLAPDGLARFLDRGTWYAEAHYGHAFTVTAAGHATMLTGAYAHRSGIIGNDWRDTTTGAPVYNSGDTSATYIDHATKPLDGTSPRNLKVESLGDVLRRLDNRSKVIAVSGKDRGAILPAGKTGTAYMYMSSSGQFASSTFYMPRHPEWVDRFNAARPADRFFKAEWKPALADAAYAQSLGDNQPWFGTRVGKLPMAYGASDDKPGPGFYGSLLVGPFADQLTLDFARAAVAGEQLGQDTAPDILSVSLSGHDYVNHAWSAESRLSHDHLLQLDRMLQDFFRHLDATVGRDRYVAVLTADHGFMPSPELSRLRGLDAGFISSSQTLQALNAALAQRFGGATPLVPFLSGPALVLDRKLIAARGLDFDTVAAAARDQLLTQPGFEAAYTRRELAGGSRAGAPYFDAMRKSWHEAVSGDVQYVLKPNWMFRSSSSNTTHGSPHRYDTHVPILFWGPAWMPAGRVDQRVEVADIAPTLARVLGVAAPSAAEGRPLPRP
jgi:predicted AlkP superfamily pyrophosphatase or phosphodiesterase